ncbi:Formate hydrogenlyase transcriptional activator [compost metagenome]
MIQSDVRIIAATSTDLQAAMARGEFRADLYYRLNVLPIQVPPLRERLDDLPALSEAILEELGSQHELEDEAQALLARHAWPGNIRELRNVLERTTLLTDQLRLGVRDVQAALGNLAPLQVQAPQVNYKQACAEFERQLLENTLARCAGNVPEAARQLGLGRSTLYKKLVALGIKSQ